jgi:hypothetical protein
MRLTPHDLTYKLSASANQEKILHTGKGVLGVQLTDGDIFRFRPATGLFARYDPLQRSFVDQKEKDQVPDTLTQQADGTGTTGDEAIRDALRNAVRGAVRVLVDGEVLIGAALRAALSVHGHSSSNRTCTWRSLARAIHSATSTSRYSQGYDAFRIGSQCGPVRTAEQAGMPLVNAYHRSMPDTGLSRPTSATALMVG